MPIRDSDRTLKHQQSSESCPAHLIYQKDPRIPNTSAFSQNNPFQLTGRPTVNTRSRRTILCRGSVAGNVGADCRSHVGVMRTEREPSLLSSGKKFGPCVARDLDLIPWQRDAQQDGSGGHCDEVDGQSSLRRDNRAGLLGRGAAGMM